MLVAGAIAIIALLGIPALVFAHAHLIRSEPSADARLATAPTSIRLWFSEQPELPFTRIVLRAADSSRIPLGAVAAIERDGVTASIAAPLSPGTYRLIWRTAAADGHATTGSFVFTVASPSVAPAMAVDTSSAKANGHGLIRADTTSELTPRLSATAATRWLEFIAMLAVVGSVMFRLFVLPGVGRVVPAGAAPEVIAELIDSARRLGLSALVLLLIASLSRLYAEAATVLGPSEQGARPPWRMLIFDTSWGRGWLVGIVGIVLAGIGFSIAKRTPSGVGWRIAAFGGAAIVIAPALTGHAIATSPVPVSVIIDGLHVAAVCTWLGALLTLLLSAVPFVRGARARSSLSSGQLVAALVRSFHPVALTCAVIVILSGIFAAWLRLPTLADLWQSTYGRVLLVKVCFVVLLMLMGSLNWRRIMPTLGDDAAARRLTRTAGTELAIAAIVLAVTAVLVSTSPPS